ncbi:hypothetical protein DV515_00011983 [Chloebia gouldiae]|uniref:C-type lectin domain-containing protein n=1 Tax=Chloebia gouldiae TaxID=44316 RepID=A0A3L8S4S7_CHLGU|nr:hypothetical protein DV515_00011983 [Chloebia gouldiae]
MRPSLLMAIALLGTVLLSHSGECPPHPTCLRGHPGDTPDLRVTQPVSAALASPAVDDEDDMTELEMPEYSGCRGASDKQALGVPSMPGTATCSYVVVSHCQTFHHAQYICANHFHGRLASIHDSHTNNFLLLLARRHTSNGLVWIGAVTQPAVRTLPRTHHPGLGAPCLLPVSPVPTPGVPAPSHDSQCTTWVPQSHSQCSQCPLRETQLHPSVPSAHLGAPALSQYL